MKTAKDIALDWLQSVPKPNLAEVIRQAREEMREGCAKACTNERVNFAETQDPSDAAYNQAIGDCCAAIAGIENK